jgi:hypothetical protein
LRLENERSKQPWTCLPKYHRTGHTIVRTPRAEAGFVAAGAIGAILTDGTPAYYRYSRESDACAGVTEK